MDNTVIAQALAILLAAALGAHYWSMAYRQRGDISAPGGTQPARVLFWLLPVAATTTPLLWLSLPAALAALVGVATGATAMLGLTLLPHGNFQSMGIMPNRAKFPVGLMLRLGIPFTPTTCFIGLSVIGAGRIALLVAPAALLPWLIDPLAYPAALWLFWASAGGLLHGVAYLTGLRFAPWPHPMLRAKTEVGEYLWGLGQGGVVCGALALQASPAVRWALGI